MNRVAMGLVLFFLIGAPLAQPSDVTATRAALVAPAGHRFNLYCGRGAIKKPLPPFNAVVRERDGKLFVKFASCEKELMLNAVDDIKGEFCNGQAFSLVHRAGDPSKAFSGKSGSCDVELTPK